MEIMSSLRLSLLAALFFSHVAFGALPQVDFDRMGKVGLAGDFAGLGLFDNTTSPFDPSTATLFSRDSDGALSRLASTNSGGRILVGCALMDVFYVAGSFSTIGGIPANNIASFTPSSNAFAALGSNGPNGEVHALYCNEKDRKVWAGGHFTSPGPSVAVWDVRSSSWSKPPFNGLSGAGTQVNSITSNSSGQSMFFAGSFITSFQGNGTTTPHGNNNPNVPFSAGSTPFSSSLVPVPLIAGGTQIDGSPSSPDSQFSNIQSILCPSGPDGPGNTWLAEDGSTAVVTARTFTFITGGGLRLGNTFQNGHGTTGFSVTTIPDNKVQQLHFIDPRTGQNQTCTDTCPLLTDPSIPYQDFLFDSSLSITGVQVKLSEFTGSGPGLHLFQILSSGAFASALDNQNAASCFAPNPSNTTRTGQWNQKVANTDIPGTTQVVLVSSADVGSSAAEGPSFTWIPYVSASGMYDINLMVPGCTNFQDCAQRTSVKVTVFPGQGMEPWVSTVSQQNPDDSAVNIYSGPILPSTPNFVTTVMMTLADKPAGNGVNGKYELVADRIQMMLKSANATSNEGSGGNGSNGSQGVKNGFGFFEYSLGLGSSVDATQTLPNTTETFSDAIAFNLFQGVGGSSGLSSSSDTYVTSVVHHPSGAIFIGGRFVLTSKTSNIAVFRDGSLSALADNGLNGPVSSLVLDGDKLYVGGSFQDTTTGSTRGRLGGVAMYDVQQNQWASFQDGVNGGVTSLGFSDGKIQVVGNFTKLLSPPGTNTGVDCSGLAVWDVAAGAWVNSGGFLVGSMSFIGNGTSPGKGRKQSQFIAGNVTTSLKFGSSGLVMLQNGGSDGPKVTSLGVQLDDNVGVSLGQNHRRRGIHYSSSPATWMQSLRISSLFARQSTSQLTPLPPPLPAPAPAVLAGVFWTNTSTSDQAVIIGGNFSFNNGGVESQGVGVYYPKTAKIAPLQGSHVNGTVRSLLVEGSMLYVGGQFTLEGTNVNGLAIYDLTKQQWDVSGLQPLQASSGSQVVVRSLTKSSSKPNTVIVAGSFIQAGSLKCQSICLQDSSSKQWSALGNGIRGDVASVAYAGSNQELLIAAGSIAVAEASVSNVAAFNFTTVTWSAVGSGSDLPGPVTAVEVNDRNTSSIFAAGRTNDGSSSFFFFWNGVSWRSLGSMLQGATSVAQLTMVPLQDTHSFNGVIEQDRMLLVSGSLTDSAFNNASSALFDGQAFIPYLTSSSSTGSPGAISSLFHSFSTFSFTQHHFLAVGVVILISIAIAAGVVFFLALIGILWTLFSRRGDNMLNKLDPTDVDDDNDSTHHRPSSLLEHINAATRSTILGAGALFQDSKGEDLKGAFSAGPDNDPFGPDASNFARAATPSDAAGGVLSGEDARPAHARYSFDAAGEGELALTSGQEVEVLDDRDPAWWYARNMQTGKEGVVPAAYLY